MRILHLTNLVGIGGIESYVKGIAQEQSRIGHDVGILVCLQADTDVTDELRKLEEVGIWTVCIDATSGHDLKLLRKLPSEIRKFHPDIIHLSSMPVFVAAALLFVPVPKFVTLHLFEVDSIKNKIGFLAYQLLVDGVIAVSDSVLDFHKNVCSRFPRASWKRIYNGISLKRFNLTNNKEFPAAGGDYVLIMICRAEQDKHVDDAIRALAIIRDKAPECSFCLKIVGDGSLLQSLKKLADDLNVLNFVEFAGYQADVLPFLLKSHGYLMLSDKETFSISTLEAMACGIPIFSYSVEGGFHELHQHERTGIVTSERTPEALAAAIIATFENLDKWRLYSHNSEITAKSFSLQNMALKTLKFYKEISTIKSDIM